MSINLPPTENDALFNTLNFKTNNESLTFEEANKKFLRYPIAQGNNILQETKINNKLVLDNEGNYTQPSIIYKTSQSGIYFNNSNNHLFLTISGKSVLNIRDDGIHNQIIGTAANPAYSFQGAGYNSTGIYADINTLKISGGGINVLDCTRTSLSILNTAEINFKGTNNNIKYNSTDFTTDINVGGFTTLRASVLACSFQNGVELFPSISNIATPTTGLYFPSSSQIGFSILGNQRFLVDDFGIVSVNSTNVNNAAIRFNAGSINTGFNTTANGSSIGFVSDGVRYGLVDSTFRWTKGSDAAPAYSFLGDTNTGLNSGASQRLDFITNGVSRLLIGNSGITTRSAIAFSADNSFGIGSSTAAAGAVYMHRLHTGRFAGGISDTTDRMTINTTTLGVAVNIQPTTNGVRNIGTDTLRFNTVFGITSDFSSDENIKENIKDVDFNCLDLVEKLKVKEYNYKESFAPSARKKTYGLIAQDLLSIAELNPDIYNIISVPQEEGGFMGVNYIGLYSLLIKAIQDLSQKVKDLENKT